MRSLGTMKSRLTATALCKRGGSLETSPQIDTTNCGVVNGDEPSD